MTAVNVDTESRKEIHAPRLEYYQMETIIFLVSVKKYIEDTEVKLDAEYGLGRTLQELIDSNLMPDIYRQVKEQISCL